MGHQKSRGGTFLETPQSFPSRPSSFIEVFGYWSELVRTHTQTSVSAAEKKRENRDIKDVLANEPLSME